MELVIINTLVPVKFCYLQTLGREGDDLIVNLMSTLAKEENQVVAKFQDLRPGVAENALQSQALLHLKKHFCDKNRCTYCSLGLKLLQKKEETP